MQSNLGPKEMTLLSFAVLFFWLMMPQQIYADQMNKSDVNARQSLQPNGVPVVLNRGDRATINHTDGNLMILRVANADPSARGRVNYTIANGIGRLEDYTIPPGMTNPQIHIVEGKGTLLTVTDTSAVKGSNIHIALYNISGSYGQELHDNEEQHLWQYKSAWFRTKHENYFDLWIENQSECSTFVVYTDGAILGYNDTRLVTYYIHCEEFNYSEEIGTDHSVITANDYKQIRLLVKSWLYVLNVSPTNTSDGNIRLYPLVATSAIKDRYFE